MKWLGRVLQHLLDDKPLDDKDHPLSALSPIRLSILLPVYNVVDYLHECIESIVTQIDHDDIEIILLDDASTDGSHKLCKNLVQSYGSIITLLAHQENRGLSAARNSLLAAAKGDYIWFVDSDDVVLPDAITHLLAVITAHKPDIILCDYNHRGQSHSAFLGRSRNLETDCEALIRGVFSSRKMHIWSKISRRTLWGDDLIFPVGKCFEDIAVTPWLLLRARNFYYAAEPWIFYRDRSESIMRKLSGTPSLFDDQKNDDLATALTGFTIDFRTLFKHPDPETLYCIAHFCGKEFTKICHRLLSRRIGRDDWASIVAKLARYQGMAEACSPLSFNALMLEYRRRRHVIGWLVMWLCLRLAKPVSPYSL